MTWDSAFSSHCLATSSSTTLMLLLTNICVEHERLDYLADVLTLRGLTGKQPLLPHPLAWVSGKCSHRLVDICSHCRLIPPDMLPWTQSHRACAKWQTPQTVHFPICESFLLCPGFFLPTRGIIRRSTWIPMQAYGALHTLQRGTTCVSPSASQSLLLSQTAALLWELWLH